MRPACRLGYGANSSLSLPAGVPAALTLIAGMQIAAIAPEAIQGRVMVSRAATSVLARACLLAVLALATIGCASSSQVTTNPTGYPAIPGNSQMRPAPTPGGVPPTPIGKELDPAAKSEATIEGEDAATEAPLSTSASSTGIPEVVGSVGSASAHPVPSPTPTPQPATSVTVTVDRSFEPATVTIQRGQAIEWRNESRSPLALNGGSPSPVGSPIFALPPGAQPWSSGIINPGSSYVQQFDLPGEYVYSSTTLEDGLVGRIIVQD